jgi:hypothetical protein
MTENREPTLQPWQFFTIVTMLAATAAVYVARGTTLANLILVSLTVMAVGLAAMAFYQTLSPLVGTEEAPAGQALEGRARLALEREKTLVLRSIKELEFDRAMGKIAEPDFLDMVARLKVRAVGLMKQLDQEAPEWRVEIERELERRLAARGVSAPPPRPVAAGAAACAACGTANDADARFCKACGARLS